MHVNKSGRTKRLLPTCKRILLAALFVSLLAPALLAADPEIFPLSQVRPGMKGEAYTIFAGDQIEKFDLVVIGVMPNFLAPRESIILVQLLGPKVEHTGVVAGMSGSPVYFDGKLAGALGLPALGPGTTGVVQIPVPGLGEHEPLRGRQSERRHIACEYQ